MLCVLELQMMLNYDNSATADPRNKFEAEFRLLAALPQHRGIIRLLSSFTDTIPASVLALLPRETADLISVDESGAQPARLPTTQFG